MRDYTYQDILKMQEEAADRVREMKKRATLAVEEEPVKEKPKSRLPDEMKRISYPVELSCEPVYDEAPQKPENPKSDEIQGLFQMLREDPDVMLILALLMVISHEHIDYMTSFALLYLIL